MIHEPTSKVNELIALLDEAVSIEDDCTRCHRVKDVLHDIVADGGDFLPASFMRPADGCYARRLLHKDPAGRYSVVVMVWDVGQGTSLHDHCGHWCVECVYRGRLRVVSYDKVSEEDDFYTFRRETEILAGIGDAGALIPPFEYHTIANALDDKPSVTIHVYAGELDWCYIFVPEGDGFRRQRRELCYSA
jgi:predicted metal-dependent enzyme (double-stranded beta helix superfamily)